MQDSQPSVQQGPCLLCHSFCLLSCWCIKWPVSIPTQNVAYEFDMSYVKTVSQFPHFPGKHRGLVVSTITSGMLLLSRMSVGSISVSSRNPWLTQVIWKINNIHQFLIQNRGRLQVFSPTKFVPAPTRRKGTRTTSQSWGEASYSHNWQSCNFWVWK